MDEVARAVHAERQLRHHARERIAVVGDGKCRVAVGGCGKAHSRAPLGGLPGLWRMALTTGGGP